MSNKAIVKGTNLTKSQKAKNRAAFLKEEGVNDKINSIAESMGVSPDEILHAIEKETAGSYSPAQKNLAGGSAVGLIQFVGTGTDKGKGGKTVNGTFYKSSDLEAMTTLEQLDVVEGYFTENFKKKGGKPGQIYNSIAAPSSVGKAGDKVIYEAGSDAAEQNPGWQNEDGSVTTDSMANFGGSPEFFTYTPQVAGWSETIEQPTTEEDGDTYSDENINAAVDKFVDWANSDNPEQAILDAVDKVNNEADKKKLQKAAENAIKQKERSEKVSNIKNKDNLDYLKRRAAAGAVELTDEDNTLIENIAEEQRIQWSKLGKPGILELAKNALGMSQGDIRVDDDAANSVMRRQVINSLSKDIDVNTPSGRQQLRQRLKSYTDLIGSDEYKDKVETLTGGGIDDSTYENMIDDLSSDYRVFIVDANKIHNLEGNDAIDYEIKSQEHLDKNLDNEGVLSDNKATIQQLIEKGNKDLANDVAERGLDAVAVDLANAQNEAAKRGDTDAKAETLLSLADKEAEMAVEKKSMDEGVSGLEAIDFGEVDEDEEEITTIFDEWKKNNPDGTLEDFQEEQKNTKPTSNNEAKISGAEKALTGLKAAAGILSLSQALRAPDVETPEISPLVTEALHKQKALAESGLTAKEKGAAMQNLNDAYAGAMKNVLRASGGQRGMFLANQGTVDANRIQGLNQLAAQDAALHRQNIGQYNQLASSVGSMKLSRDMNVEQMRQATLSNNRQILSGVGSNLLSDAISDVSYYMNPNREKTQALLDQLSKGQNADTSGFNKSVETANTNPTNQKQVDKNQVANQKKTNV